MDENDRIMFTAVVKAHEMNGVDTAMRAFRARLNQWHDDPRDGSSFVAQIETVRRLPSTPTQVLIEFTVPSYEKERTIKRLNDWYLEGGWNPPFVFGTLLHWTVMDGFRSLEFSSENIS